ncbi:MAG: DNA translocase FtsK [Chloroflexota bacterium]
MTTSSKRKSRVPRRTRPRVPFHKLERSAARVFRRQARRLTRKGYPRLVRTLRRFARRELAAIALLLLSGLGILSFLSGHEAAGAGGRTAGDAGGPLGYEVGSFLLANLAPAGAFLMLLTAAAVGLWLLVGTDRLTLLFGSGAPLQSRPRRARASRVSRPAQGDTEPALGARASRPSGSDDLGPAAGESPPDVGRGLVPRRPEPGETPAPPVRTDSKPPEPRPLPRAGRWPRPPLDLLEASSGTKVDGTAGLERRSRIIDETFRSFGVDARVANVRHGPAVTRFGISPAPGVKVARIMALSNDIALRLGAAPLRMEAPVPGECVVGIEVPNEVTEMVSLRDLMEAPAYAARTDRLKIALGRDVSGKPVVADLARMPHLLIAGATGSGKSVCLNGIILALLLQYSPDELQMMLIDPKKVEMTPYDGVPHLLTPVITEMEQVVPSLRWVVKEMERRYRIFAAKGFRNIEGFNKASPEKRGGFPMTYVVVVVDELADLMMTASDDVERILCRLAQLARATGIHLVIATQRPSVDVVTGLIKANFPTRIAFAVTSQVDSRTILDQVGAEKLVGRGDALYLAADSAKPLRLQGAYSSDAEIRAVVECWKKAHPTWGEPGYEGAVAFEAIEDDEADELYEKAEELAVEHDGKLSISFIQRKLRIGYARAKRLRAALEKNDLLESSGTGDEEGAEL